MSELTSDAPDDTRGALSPAFAVLAWLWVLVPFGYGLFQLVVKIPALFSG